MTNQKGFVPPIVLSGGILIVLLGIGFYFYNSTKVNNNQSHQLDIASTQPEITPDLTITPSSEIDPEISQLPKMTEIATAEEKLKIKQVVAALGFKTFKSKEFGFSFEYPSEWGDLSEKVYIAAESGMGDSGKVYTYYFSNNPNVNGGGNSDDYSAGRGGPAGYFNTTSLTGPVRFTIDVQDSSCAWGNREISSYRGILNFNLTNTLHEGITFLLPPLSESDIDRIKKRFPIPTDSLDCMGDETSNPKLIMRQRDEQIKNYIEKDQQLDKESLRNLFIYERITKSAKIN